MSHLLDPLHLSQKHNRFQHSLCAGYVLILFSLFRSFSRNYDRRRSENNKFLSITNPLTRRVRQMRAQTCDREHKYFRCPNCGQMLRVPKGKGKISISCRNCGTTFQKKT